MESGTKKVSDDVAVTSKFKINAYVVLMGYAFGHFLKQTASTEEGKNKRNRHTDRTLEQTEY